MRGPILEKCLSFSAQRLHVGFIQSVTRSLALHLNLSARLPTCPASRARALLPVPRGGQIRLRQEGGTWLAHVYPRTSIQ